MGKQFTCSLLPWRFLRSRSRPLTFLLVFVSTWFLLTVFYLQRSTSSQPAQKLAVQTLQVVRKQTAKPVRHVPQPAPQPRVVKPVVKANETKPVTLPPVPSERSGNATIWKVSTTWDNDSDFQEEEREFLGRRERYEKICKTGVAGGVGMVYYYEKSRLSVCHVPKVGCTFWKRAFHFLYNETGGRPVNSLYDIDRFYVHFGAMGKVKAAGYASKKGLLDQTNKVLYARDPYARLWSAYVDKFVLPDSWLDHGRSIVRRRKKGHKPCADDIQFPEFLDFVLNANRDVHWTPIHRVCNPCQFRPQYIGKLETFSRDTTHILRRVGLESLVEGKNDHSHYVEDEIRILTKYTFRLYETRAGVRACLTHSGVAERLWKAFVLNGYISGDLTFPKAEMSSALDGLKTPQASEKAVELLLKAHGEGPVLSSSEMKAYRRNVMVQNYKAAPPHLLKKLVDLFHVDFALFDYEPKPSDIFS